MKTKTQTVFDWVFQSYSLPKEEKQEFVSRIEAVLNTHGFQKVSKVFGGDRKYYKAIRFEKLNANKTGQWIEFTFEKYGQRSFYVTVGISATFSPNKHLLVAHVVRRKNKNQYWWGSQWYSIFRQKAWSRAAKRVLNKLPSLVTYLDEAEPGTDIHQYVVLGSMKPKH